MKTKYLLPNYLKMPGWIILGIGVIFSVWYFAFDEVMDIKLWMPALHNHFPMDSNSGLFKLVYNSIIDEIAGTFIIIGSLFVAFSSEKEEDEYIMKIRLESLVWAVIVNSILMIFCIFAFYGLSFTIAIEFNLVTVLILFVIKFQIALRKAKSYEK
jgi:hypothetical protein